MAGAERLKAPRLRLFLPDKGPFSWTGFLCGDGGVAWNLFFSVSVGYTRLFVPPKWTKGAAAMERGSSADRFLGEQKRKSKGLFKMSVSY